MTMTGAPTVHGDWLDVHGQPCQVVEIERLPDPQPFGLHWALIVSRASDGAWLNVVVDDDARNRAHRIGPSSIVED